jgi:hypothetical protein
MRKSYIRRALALSMIGVMMLVGAATGCGKKKVDYNVDDEKGTAENGSTSDSGELRAKVKAPESYTGDIPVGDSGLSSIRIDADKIDIPDVSTMSVAYCESVTYDDEFKKKLIESILDKSKGIYKYDYEKPVREDVQKELDMYQTMLEDANAAGDTENSQWISGTVDSLKSDLNKATDNRDPAGDVYDGGDYVGYIGDQMYEIAIYGDEAGESTSFSLSPYPYVSLKDIRPLDDYYNVSCYEDDYNNADLENQSDMSSDEAVSFAASYLAELGYKDIALKSCSPLIWDYLDYAGNTKVEECDGWTVTFVKAVDNVPVYSPEIFNLDYINSYDVIYTSSEQTLMLRIYDGKVFQAGISCSLNTVSQDNNVELLSWDDILKSAQEKIPEFYKDNKTSYMDIVFDRVKLTYYRVKDADTEGQLKLIPVWAFISTGNADGDGETATEESAEEAAAAIQYPQQLILINAIDGSLVDVVGELDNGGYQSYDVDRHDTPSLYQTEEDTEAVDIAD